MKSALKDRGDCLERLDPPEREANLDREDQPALLARLENVGLQEPEDCLAKMELLVRKGRLVTEDLLGPQA